MNDDSMETSKTERCWPFTMRRQLVWKRLVLAVTVLGMVATVALLNVEYRSRAREKVSEQQLRRTYHQVAIEYESSFDVGSDWLSQSLHSLRSLLGTRRVLAIAVVTDSVDFKLLSTFEHLCQLDIAGNSERLSLRELHLCRGIRRLGIHGQLPLSLSQLSYAPTVSQLDLQCHKGSLPEEKHAIEVVAGLPNITRCFLSGYGFERDPEAWRDWYERQLQQQMPRVKAIVVYRGSSSVYVIPADEKSQ